MPKDAAMQYLDQFGPNVDPRVLAQNYLAPAAPPPPDVTSSADAGAHDLIVKNVGQSPRDRAYAIANAAPGSPRPPPSKGPELEHTKTTLRDATEKARVLDEGVRAATRAGAQYAQPTAPGGPPAPGGGGGGLLRAGRWELGIDPARAQEYSTGAREEREGIAAQGAAESAASDKIAEAERIHGEDQAIGRLKREQEEKSRQAALEAHEAKLTGLLEEHAKGEIDPDHFWSSRTMPQKILSIASLVAGGFLQGFRGVPNPAQAMIDRAIDQDIAAQRANLEKKGRDIEHQKGLLAETYRRFGRMDAAEESARMVMEQEYASKLKQIGAESNSPIVQARVEQALGKHDQDIALRRQSFEKYAPPVYAGSSVGAPVKNQALVFMGPDGQRYVARDAESRKKLAEAVAANQDMKGTLAAYQAANEKLSVIDRASIKTGTPTAAAAQATTLYYTALSKERQLQNDGVYKKSEEPMFPKILAPPDRILGSSKGQANAAIQHADRELSGTIKAEDPLPVTQSFGPKGPQAGYTGGTYQPPAPAAPQQPQGNPAWFKP